MKDFIVKVPKEYFQLEDDCYFFIDFLDMHRLMWGKDFDIAQVNPFAM